jgi:hypothetical protein
MEYKTVIIYSFKDGVFTDSAHIKLYPNGKLEGIESFIHKYFGGYTYKFFKKDNVELENYEDIFNDLEYAVLQKNIENKKIGKIRVAQQAKGRSYPVVNGFENIPAWSRGKGRWKELSPFHIKFADGTIFENFFQSHKTWRKVDKQNKKDWAWPAQIHVDDNENPNTDWYEWHNALLAHDMPVRRPNGKAIPLYSFWNGERLGVVESRKQIYIHYLQQLYRAHPVYMELLEKVKNGENIMIIEPDGPYLDAYPHGLEVDLQMLKDLISVTNYSKEGYPEKYRPFGHGMVIVLTLLEDLQ